MSAEFYYSMITKMMPGCTFTPDEKPVIFRQYKNEESLSVDLTRIVAEVKKENRELKVLFYLEMCPLAGLGSVRLDVMDYDVILLRTQVMKPIKTAKGYLFSDDEKKNPQSKAARLISFLKGETKVEIKRNEMGVEIINASDSTQ